MKVIYDKGKKQGIYRFLKYNATKSLDSYDEPIVIIILGILGGVARYSFKHKCWILKY